MRMDRDELFQLLSDMAWSSRWPVVKPLWIAALRSNEFQQGKQLLHNTYTKRHCCLGVLCVITGIPATDGQNGAIAYGMKGPSGDFHSGSTLEYEVKKFLGMPENLNVSTYPGDDVVSILMSMNDSQNKSFGEIADWIETNL